VSRVYAADDDGNPQFQALPAPEDQEIERLAAVLAERISKSRKGTTNVILEPWGLRAIEPGPRLYTAQGDPQTLWPFLAVQRVVCHRPLPSRGPWLTSGLCWPARS
jgi:hypothetical protein